ncbi:MAG: mechanosensitive ion channel domain-containing protein [Candidatus Nealsonbacteria bacterium]
MIDISYVVFNKKIKVSGIEGRVKEITLRKTVIESSDGSIHSIPNSKVTVVSKKQ